MADIEHHPALQRARLRAKMERVIDKLVSALDALDGDPDFEDGDEDEEHDGREPSEDDEHSLGATEGPAGSVGWVHGGSDDGEPSLGSLELVDQRRWADGGCDGWAHRDQDLELACEDEGGACEDEGAADYD